jgi:hypothetical protein
MVTSSPALGKWDFGLGSIGLDLRQSFAYSRECR